MNSSHSLALYHTAPNQVEVVEEPIPDPQAGEVLVRTLLSGISPGTERLLYRGEFPPDQAVDVNITTLSNQFSYPLKYGYSAVGEVIKTGVNVDQSWMGKTVFAFNPHESCFCASVDQLHPLPEHISLDNGIFLPNMETAVNLVMDGSPIVSERVLILGQGILGLLTTGVLSLFPLERLVTLDRYPIRRDASIEIGASLCLDPSNENTHLNLKSSLPNGADLTFELTGSPQALDNAIEHTGYDGRIVVGSWYGTRRSPVNLGGAYHRRRIHLISSQVSTIAPRFSGRWNKQRRFQTAWEMIHRLVPARFITHRFNISKADEAFKLLDGNPQQAIQVVFEYE